MVYTSPNHTLKHPGGRNGHLTNISIYLYPLHDNKFFGPYIGQNVSPAAHAVFGIAVIYCGIECYGT